MIITRYGKQMKADFERFREAALSEGNRSLLESKFDPNTLKGETWCVWVEGKIVSVSAVEFSHYTGDPEVAGRVCRYHVLKKYRHKHMGFKMLRQQIEWAEDTGLKILYWTHDITNITLNMMYQHRVKMVDKESFAFFESDWYQRVQLDRRWLFESGDLLQYVYYIDLQNEGFEWKPQDSVKWLEHDGTLFE